MLASGISQQKALGFRHAVRRLSAGTALANAKQVKKLTVMKAALFKMANTT
jgi:hypothetical protein